MRLRGFLLSMDAMVAVGVMLMLVAFLSAVTLGSYSPELRYQRSYYAGKDILNLMKNLRMEDVWDYPLVQQYVSEGRITDENLNHTILDMIGHFWSSGNSSLAGNLTDAVLGGLIGDSVNFQVLMNGEAVYTKGDASSSQLSRLNTIASGYSKDEVISGYSTKAFLTRMTKTASRYAYFGGFEGEGNLTKTVNITNLDTVMEAVMEVDAGGPFDLFINANHAGSYIPGGGAKTRDAFTVCNQSYQSAYCSHFSNGQNTVKLNFTTPNVTGAFVGGGFLRVTYNSTEPITEGEAGSQAFPGIEGFVNLYSSFFVPGNLRGMGIHLHYRNSYDTFMNIGNVTVHEGVGGAEVTEDISNASLYAMLDYQGLSNKTVPIRIGTRASQTIEGGNADVILITDVSGSMNYRLGSSSTGVERNCDDPNLFSPSTKRISLAKCLDKEFVSNVLNYTGNRVGLVAYSGVPSYVGARSVVVISTTHPLSADKSGLESQINGYAADGATGICGSIRQARAMLQQQSNSSRNPFIVVMSDGLANVQCDPDQADENVTVGCINYICPWSWYLKCYGRTDCLYYTCGEYVSDLASQDAVDDACKAKDYANATIYSIGFGPVATCDVSNQTLNGIAECGDGFFYSGTDAEALREVYQNISQTIANLSYQAQTVEITDLLTNNTLYPDSHISYQYESFAPDPQYGEITFNLEGPSFGGESASPQEGYFYVFGNVTVLDARLLSYSSEHWTDRAAISNSQTGGWHEFYRLWDFGTDYTVLGDLFEIHVPSGLVAVGENNSVRLDTAISPGEPRGGSPDDKAVFSISKKAYVGYGSVFPRSVGSTKTIWYDIDQDGVADGSTTLPIGLGSDAWDPGSDSLDDALSRLLDELNFYGDTGDDDGSQANPVDVCVIDVRFDSGSITRVPGMWGPVRLEVRVWSD
jgi:hypothetical protein